MKAKWAKTPCFYIIKASKKSIGMTGATSEFEDEIKKLNDYIKIPGYRRALPARRWDPILAITGFHHYYDAKRFQIHADNSIICARNVFRRSFTEDFPKENPRSFKRWKIHWSKELNQDMIRELAFGWDIEDFKNDMVQSRNKNISNAYIIEHVKSEFEDFLPRKEILDEWKILKEEKKL
ncbi:7122_t:CDS:2 [Scutellospora calospora]|uniref:7122_t:CDS:1 n=1 Tax=Scutellospora calospora TaxID=85575 RepID=A0ACA9L6J5_9GLOM|nr:7122_t:CDS:2 [Scutellospora calospora]